MKKSKKFTPEFRERAVRMVQEQRGEHPSLWVAVVSIAPKLECVPQTLLCWTKQHELDQGQRKGVTTDEAQRVKDLRGNEERTCQGVATEPLVSGFRRVAYASTIKACAP
jgi:transposase